LPEPEALERVYQSYGDQYSFFTALESIHLSKLLAEVRTRVRMTKSAGGGEVTYRDLSEGEQQLLLVLGLLKFTARDEALFLLDEPDTHLNPVWSTQYLDFLDRFIQLRERGDSCFRRNSKGEVVAETPENDPRGMGVAAILTSDLFRLRTTLDSNTQTALDRQRTLAMKTSLNGTEEKEFTKLGQELRSKGFTQSIRDPLYEIFLRAWTEREDPQWRESVDLSPEQQQRRAKLAAQIVDELKGQQRSEK
jgi:hypothetical protein